MESLRDCNDHFKDTPLRGVLGGSDKMADALAESRDIHENERK